ncbi:MAG: hypothetical protein GXP50_01440 [Deltaproteobacteria bacterium]|nr:hypothetical protein [Deltaproteobacteria bacterium]
MTRSTRKLLFLAVVMGVVGNLAVGIPAAQARLVISPALLRVDLDGERPRGAFTLTNVGEKTERYRARAVHFRLSEAGGLQLVEPDQWSLAPWIRFNPAEFELPPNASRVVRYTILVPSPLEQGQYWGGIEFEPLQSSVYRFSDGKGKNLSIHVLNSALVPIFAKKGSPRVELEVADAKAVATPKGPGIVIRLENRGETRVDVRGSYRLVREDGAEVAAGPVPEVMILRAGARLVGIRPDPPPAPGSYKLELELELRQLEKPMHSVFPVRWGS